MRLGSGEWGELTILDIVTIISFLLAIENLNLNVTQEDAQNLQQEMADKADLLLKEIHGHLEEQDNKINEIMEVLAEWKKSIKKYQQDL